MATHLEQNREELHGTAFFTNVNGGGPARPHVKATFLHHQDAPDRCWAHHLALTGWIPENRRGYPGKYARGHRDRPHTGSRANIIININRPLSSSRRRTGFGEDLGFIDLLPLATTPRQGEVWTRPAFRAAPPCAEEGQAPQRRCPRRQGANPLRPVPPSRRCFPHVLEVVPDVVVGIGHAGGSRDGVVSRPDTHIPDPSIPIAVRGTLTTHRLLGCRIADRGIVGVGTHVDYDGVVDAVGEETLALAAGTGISGCVGWDGGQKTAGRRANCMFEATFLSWARISPRNFHVHMCKDSNIAYKRKGGGGDPGDNEKTCSPRVLVRDVLTAQEN